MAEPEETPEIIAPKLKDDCFALPEGVDWTPVDVALKRLHETLSPVVGSETLPVAQASGQVGQLLAGRRAGRAGAVLGQHEEVVAQAVELAEAHRCSLAPSGPGAGTGSHRDPRGPPPAPSPAPGPAPTSPSSRASRASRTLAGS